MADIGAPDQAEVERITNEIMTGLGEADLESALTVLCGITGQVVAAMAEGKPGLVAVHSASVHKNIHRAALAKLLHDHDKKREEDATTTSDTGE